METLSENRVTDRLDLHVPAITFSGDGRLRVCSAKRRLESTFRVRAAAGPQK